MASLPRGADLKLLGLEKRFGQHPVLRGINLELPPGQFVAIVGRSGCGKSTLLRLVAGLESSTDGGILIDDNSLRQLNRSARVMFQDARLLPWRRVLENVGLGLQGNWREQALWALQQVGLAARTRDWIAPLSGGQRQRVALARALVSKPRLMLLDEPLGALDALTRTEMQHLIETLWLQQQFTTLLVTHDVEEAVALADRVIMLDEGLVALDLTVNLPRPRQRQELAFVSLVDQILKQITGAVPAGQSIKTTSSRT
ncbi:MAG: ATP-binding cassette domain-containing protein [Stenomitos rutilans HA7619-LM2]|jgi:sulfonate transport system ATP-binding protein|nr:ATP-binding cassette domain-containing protein [Stenomitos rutilans HA7619-LM2]